MALDTVVLVLPIFGVAVGATLGAVAVHWVREHRPTWWPGYRNG